MADFYGFNMPFISNFGILQRQEDEQLIKNDLLSLLYTEVGERVMRPDYGVRLKSLVFEQLDINMIVNIKENISSQVAKYEPRVILTNIEVETKEDQNLINIKVYFVLRKDPTKVLSISRFIQTGNI